jgi:hypothetical protein
MTMAEEAAKPRRSDFEHMTVSVHGHMSLRLRGGMELFMPEHHVILLRDALNRTHFPSEHDGELATPTTGAQTDG